jgi:transcriptional regulator with PAS, ATPase and Fis domain
LLFRLDTLSITVPPLASRVEDIVPLARQFLRRFARRAAKPVGGISDEAVAMLEQYDWPGNMTELRDVIRTAVNTTRSRILAPEDLLCGPSRRVVFGMIDTADAPSSGGTERDRTRARGRARRRVSLTTEALSNRLSRYRAGRQPAHEAQTE